MRDMVMTGPFLSASLALEKMATNLYFAHLLAEAAEKQQQCQIELTVAEALGDEALIKQCEADLAIVERAYEITAMLDFDDSTQ